jgi:hypothetical protein
MKWAENVARWGRRGMNTGVWWESQKTRDHNEDIETGWGIILKLILEK